MTVSQLRAMHESADELDEFTNEYLVGKIQTVIDKAQGRWGDRIAARLASGHLTAHLYAETIGEAVFRVVRNPDGFRRENEGNYGYERSAVVAGGWLFFSSENMIDLIGYDPGATSKIGTARTSRYRGGV
ncbi:hypothetical protein MN032_11115 [Agromyces atrinae]|uniref:hypothetical protein n=1 Tax=Agromyces atrinae TaxID=592376 RepID=UPI001F57B5DC|nr:hypothetical protein [Agromyces atrinae]MCI2958248.1 hypothetical protein [Agromyces atrinae]